MPASRVSTRKRQASVFLNFPFDTSYEPLGISLVAAVVGLGREPHCVLEIADGGQGRLSRIMDLMRSCAASIHDLSRVQSTDGYPRFNMPFELGLACFYSKAARTNHSFFILEEKPHRLDRTLSDVKGIDPHIHERDPQRLIRKVRHCLRTAGEAALTERQLLEMARALTESAKEMKRKLGLKHIFEDASTYRELVSTATIFLDEVKAPGTTPLSAKGRLGPPLRGH